MDGAIGVSVFLNAEKEAFIWQAAALPAPRAPARPALGDRQHARKGPYGFRPIIILHILSCQPLDRCKQKSILTPVYVMKLCGLKAGVSLYRGVNIIHAGFPPEADPPLADIPLRHEWRGFLRHLKDKIVFPDSLDRQILLKYQRNNPSQIHIY